MQPGGIDLVYLEYPKYKQPRKEYIICSAIYYEDGVVHPHQPKNIKIGIVISGRRHHNCIATRSATTIARLTPHTQGFITSDDNFVDRFEAAHIAFAAGQIEERTKCLHSEDLF